MTTTTKISRARVRFPAAPLRAIPRIPPLENGATLTANEFWRRYRGMNEDFKAELIDGMVFLKNFPVSSGGHGIPDGLLHYWAGHYSLGTPGVIHSPNSTILLGPKNTPQPDSLLRVETEKGGTSQLDDDGYVVGPPELVIEIAASSASIDVRKKRDAYRDAKVPEYLVWRTYDSAVNWWYLENGEYVELKQDKFSIIRSRIFPGLWLNVPALLKRDLASAVATLNKGLKSAEHKRFLKQLHMRKVK